MEKFTIIVYTENQIGLLNRITTLFTQRHINIESLTVSESHEHGIHRFTIMIKEEEGKARKVIKQIEKQVEVLQAELHTDDEVIYQEIALYKVPIQVKLEHKKEIEKLIRSNHARILAVEGDSITIEKTGHKDETERLLNDLRPYHVMEFVRSGRVAITRSKKELAEILENLENNFVNNH